MQQALRLNLVRVIVNLSFSSNVPASADGTFEGDYKFHAQVLRVC